MDTLNGVLSGKWIPSVVVAVAIVIHSWIGGPSKEQEIDVAVLKNDVSTIKEDISDLKASMEKILERLPKIPCPDRIQP